MNNMAIDIRFSSTPDDVLYTIRNKAHFIKAVDDAWSWSRAQKHSCYIACPDCLPDEWFEVSALTFFRNDVISEYEYHKAWCELIKAQKYLNDLAEIVEKSWELSPQIKEETIRGGDDD